MRKAIVTPEMLRFSGDFGAKVAKVVVSALSKLSFSLLTFEGFGAGAVFVGHVEACEELWRDLFLDFLHLGVGIVVWLVVYN